MLLARVSLLACSMVFVWRGPALAQDGTVPQIARPVHHLFPGATNPNITAANIMENICKQGWTTKSIRPPSSYTTALKKEQIKNAGYDVANELPRVPTKTGNSTRPDITKCVERSSNPSCYEEDHLISLELGGNPRDPDNLWPQARLISIQSRVDNTKSTLRDMRRR